MVARLGVRVLASRVEVVRTRRGRDEWRAQCDYQDVAGLEEVLACLARTAGWKRPRTAMVVLAGGELVQERHLKDLPPVPVASLREIVALQQTRFFRRPGGPLVTAARYAQLDSIQPIAHAVAAEAELLEAIHRGLAKAGVKSVRIAHEGSTLELLVPSHSFMQATKRRQYRRMLLGVGIALWLSSGVIHMVRLASTERQLSARLREFAAAERAIAAARHRLTSAATMITILDSAQHQARAIPTMVERLVEAVPDSAWIVALSLKSEVGEVTTLSVSSGLLRARLKGVTGVVDLNVEQPLAVVAPGSETATAQFRWTVP